MFLVGFVYFVTWEQENGFYRRKEVNRALVVLCGTVGCFWPVSGGSAYENISKQELLPFRNGNTH